MAGVTAGERYSLPVFFTTQQPPEAAPWRGARGARAHDRAARAAALWVLGYVRNKADPIWPANGSVDWPGLVEGWGSLRHDLAPNEKLWRATCG